MRSCDILNYGLESIITEAESNEEATNLWIDERVQSDPNHKSYKSSLFMKKIYEIKSKYIPNKKDKKLDLKTLNKLFGSLDERLLRRYVKMTIVELITMSGKLLRILQIE
jgi:hypothetical protein